MKFTKNELLFLNSLSKGTIPFGVNVPIPKAQEERKTVIQDTIKSLQQKYILDENQKFTKEGIIPIKLWECYRNSKKHFIINYLKGAKLEDGRVILVTQQGEDYDITCVDPSIVLVILLKQSSFMKNKTIPDAPKQKWKKLEFNEWQQMMQSYIDTNLMVGEFENQKAISEKVYYWSQNEGYVYNLQRQRYKPVTPQEMRTSLLKMLGVTQRLGR